MFLDGGHVYVYQIYGIHHCLNVVSGTENEGAAVLIRAVEPLEGIELIWQNRYAEELPAELSGCRITEARLPVKLAGVSNGPGKLCQAFNITVEKHDGADLAGPLLWITSGTPVEKSRIGTSVRIGLPAGKGTEKPWRFFDRNSPFLSR